ncbi:DNA-binding response regulator, NarL/FixJ family, contains REC and HTH domains [Micromonospora inyonensis]|uniref:DNA-binding response regulator, NarL/FixJ family, contains REC and HTH domains n=2 Tax=Micromonospora inyonensis TaxID=47866 RepID=A0A1C6S771_9ACTN|nr:DNA-binding response regulator, NarL/FixJ family, contains REC and HTH domains [Micromonospora inyonensis]
MTSANNGSPIDGPIRILLCDSQPMTRIGLKTILSECPDILVVGETANGEQAVRAARRLQPNIVLADADLTGLDAVTLTERITSVDLQGDTVRRAAVVLMISNIDGNVFEALRVGASGVLLKTCDVDELIWAVKVVREGNRFLAPQIIGDILDHIFGFTLTRAGNLALESLTLREREVLDLVSKGMSNQEIGKRLHIGEPTVKYHVSQTLRKLDLRDRVQAVAFAYRNGLVDRELPG